MYVQFIYPDIGTGFYPGAHHGLAMLGGAVRAAGHQASLLHLTSESELEDLSSRLDESADLYAFSAMTNQFGYVREMAPLANRSGKPVLIGGLHATLKPSEAMAVDGVAFVIVGEGDLALPALLGGLSTEADLSAVPGLWRQEDGTWVDAPPQPVEDIEALPEPDYDLFDMKRIVHDLGGRLSVVISRGCSFRCRFCCNAALAEIYPSPGKYVRRMSPAAALDRVEKLVSAYQPTSIRFEDDLLLLDSAWRETFLTGLASRLGLGYECNCRADIVTPKLTELLKATGCISADLGVESGDETLRNRLLGKAISDEQLLTAFRRLHAAGIATYAYNMIGLPHETAAMAKKTLQLNRRLQPSAGNVFYFYPYPGTALAEQAKAEGLLRDDLETIRSYTDQPSVLPESCSYREIRNIFRRLRGYLLLRRFENFFPLSQPLRWLLIRLGGWGLACFPALVDGLIRPGKLKRALRRMSFQT